MKEFPYKIFISIANRDFLTAKIVLDSQYPLYDIVCFHLQQCIEKFLKAFLLLNEIDAVRTHSIPYLLDKVTNIDISFKKFLNTRISSLNSCGVDIRYYDLEDVDSEFVIQSFYEVEDFIKFISPKF